MLRMDHAYSYSEELTRALTIDAKTRIKTFPVGDQFAPELIHFSDCIRTGKRPEPDGAEGLADIRIVESIFKSAASGRAVKIAPIKSPKLMNPSQAIKRPPVREPKLVKVKPPHKGK